MNNFVVDNKVNWNMFKYPTNGKGRDESFPIILEELKKIVHPKIIEIGCIRAINDWSAGNSSELFSWFVSTYGGSFTTVDTNARNMVLCASIINKYRNSKCKINTIVQNGINFLQETEIQADFIYLDATDANEKEYIDSAVIHYNMFQAYRNKLKPGTIIAIDDILDGLKGKGYILIPYFRDELGYEVLYSGYQWIFRTR